MFMGAEIVNATGGPKISAKYERPSKRRRDGANNEWRRFKNVVDKATMENIALEAMGISKEANSVIGRWLVFGHLSPTEAEAARRVAIWMARFDQHFTEGRRSAKSPSYERAYGADQEVERHEFEGTTKEYEAAARKARKRYDKIQRVLGLYGGELKNAVDQMCCEDIEPPAEYREQIAAVLRVIAHEFKIKVERRGRPRKRRG